MFVKLRFYTILYIGADNRDNVHSFSGLNYKNVEAMLDMYLISNYSVRMKSSSLSEMVSLAMHCGTHIAIKLFKSET